MSAGVPLASWKTQMFESLLRLALSDDRVYPRERQALERVSDAFGVSHKSLDQRLSNLKH